MNTALDSLSQTLNIECCWIQTISDRKNQKLYLAGDRGFTDDMRAEIQSMDLKHEFSGQIIGVGNKITIPDLNNDGVYGLESFRTAGYKWLVAVPLMTYRAYGILGTASLNKKLLAKDTADLIMVIGALIANALSKAELTGSFYNRRSKPPEPAVSVLEMETTLSETKTSVAPDTPSVNAPPDIESPRVLLSSPQKPIDPVFQSHIQKMKTFRKTHGK